MKLPEGMTQAQVDWLARRDQFAQLAVLERASLIYDGNRGIGWAEAYERAFAAAGLPTQKALVA
jgi:hypothetical protein